MIEKLRRFYDYFASPSINSQNVTKAKQMIFWNKAYLELVSSIFVLSITFYLIGMKGSKDNIIAYGSLIIVEIVIFICTGRRFDKALKYYIYLEPMSCLYGFFNPKFI